MWAALADIGKWWDPEHTYSGDSRNLTLEPFVRGCFCEKLSLYAGIEHATVDLCAAGENVAPERRARAAAGIRRQRRDDLATSSPPAAARASR